METIKDLQKAMRDYDDVGVALQIQNAIQVLLENGRLNPESWLSRATLGEIRQQLYNQPKSPGTLFQAMLSKTGNPTEAALQYIEKLQQEARG